MKTPPPIAPKFSVNWESYTSKEWDLVKLPGSMKPIRSPPAAPSHLFLVNTLLLIAIVWFETPSGSVYRPPPRDEA